MGKEETSKQGSEGKICVSPPRANSPFTFLSTNQSLFIKVISPPSPTHRVKGERLQSETPREEGVICPLLPAETPPILLPFRRSSLHV